MGGGAGFDIECEGFEADWFKRALRLSLAGVWEPVGMMFDGVQK